jgi:PAS domain S-box-containing protein
MDKRKQPEEVLKSQNLLLNTIINSHKDILIFSLDNAYCYTAFNEMHRQEMKKIWKVDIQIGMNLLECMTKSELKKLAKQSIDRAFTGEIFLEIQHHPEPDIYYEFNWNPIWQNNEIVGVIALIKDITRSTQIEKDLIINEALFREYFDNMTSGSAIFKVLNDGSKGSDYIIRKINRIGLKMEGKELEEVVGKKFIDIRPAIDTYGLIPVMKKVWKTGESAIFQTKLYSDERYSNYYENYVFKLPSGEVVTLYNDVTESKKAAEELIESEERFRMLASKTPDHIILQDDKLRYTLIVNPQLGLTEKEMLGKTDYDFLSKEEADKLSEIKRQVFDTGKPYQYETYLTSKNGKQEFFDGVYVPRFDASGNCVGLIGYFRNITERKNAEEQIKTILRTTIDGFYLVDTDGRILDTNDAYCSMIGYSREELIKMKVKDIEAVDTEEVIKKRIQRILETGYARFETKHLRKDGSVIAVEASVNYLIDEKPLLFCFMRDISGRKEAEEKLKEKETDLNHAQKIANIGSWKFDNKTQMPVWSENMYHIFGLNPENGPLDYPDHKKIIYPDDWEEFDNAVQLASGTGNGYKLNIRIRRPNGEIRWIITESETKKDSDGNVVELFGVCQDITERKLLEDELRRREARYRTILQTALDGFWVTDLHGNFLDINESYSQLIGYNRNELLNMSITDVEALEKKTETKQHIQRVIEKGSDRFESKHRCKNGKVIDLEISVNYLPTEARLFVFLHNITERNLGKAALQESEERYRQLVEGSPDAIAVHLNGKIVFVNSVALRLIGAKSPQDLLGSSVLDIVHPDSRNKVIERLQLEAKGKEAPLVEEKFVKFDGSVIDVEVVGLPYPYLGKNATQVVIRDITERKFLENKTKERIREIERSNNLMIGREFRMIELKKEVNELFVRLGEKKKYRIPK